MPSFLRLLRYRFFLWAGLLPYFLGAATAYQALGSLELSILLLGLLGLGLAFGGVEIFNEAFDPADTLLRSDEAAPHRPPWWWGAACFGAAFPVGLYLTLTKGPWVMALAFLGFVIALFYVGPPVRLVYRGLGELGIFLAYGPLMVLGSYYLQASRLDGAPLLVSLVPGTLILSLAILNEIPDYYQDLLVGKRNMVVRWGRRRGVALYASAILSGYLLQVFLVLGGLLPSPSLLTLLTLPLAMNSIHLVGRYYEEPRKLLPAVNITAVLYLIINSFLALSYLMS